MTLVENEDEETDSVVSALNAPAAPAMNVAAEPPAAAPLVANLSSLPLEAAGAEASLNERLQDRGLSLALVQEWLKRASESLEESPLEDGPLEDSLLSLLSMARLRPGPRR